MHEAERGLFDLQQGRPLHVVPTGVDHQADAVLLAAVDGIGQETLERLRAASDGTLRLAVTHHRARAMGLTNGGSPRALSLRLRDGDGPADMFRLSSAVGGPPVSSLDVRDASLAETGGLLLARLGRLLPAVVSAKVDATPSAMLQRLLAEGSVLRVTTSQIEAMQENARVGVIHVSEGPVPLEDAEGARFMCFREANGVLEHVAVLIGDRASWPDPVPVRIHSACLTGDLFGSLRCDCGEQLRGSLRYFTERGGGVLLYLSHEGRGIGLGNKLRAYALQQDGLDTVDADGALGFGADERRYEAAVHMLRHMDVERIQLLTNNPAKVRAMEDGGLTVVDRRPLYGTLNHHNRRYVEAKVRRAGHWLTDMLSGALPTK